MIQGFSGTVTGNVFSIPQSRPGRVRLGATKRGGFMKRRRVCLLAFLFFGATLLFAQQGSLGGIITDPSGAFVASARINVTSVTTGLSQTVISEASGYYILPSIAPGDYTLKVEASGFATFSQQFTLHANQAVTSNVQLKLGAASEKVTVQAAPPQVNTTNATLSEVVDQQRIVNLPLNGRNAATLTLLAPGTTGGPPTNDVDQGQSKTFPGAQTISTNGSRQNEVSYQLDGGNNVDQYTNVNLPFPFPDALEEFSLQTSNYSAEYGQNAGGVVNVVTKSGSNQVHGDAFWFVRNAVFDARNYFASQVDPLKRNQFGGVIGGPVVIPNVYNGHDRTFFFFGYQGTIIRDEQGGQSAFVPTQANLNGDFSAYLNANDPNNALGQAVILTDPTTGQPFPGNKIPTTRFDAAALGVERFLPQSTGNGLVFYSQPIHQNFNELVARIDHSLSARDQLTIRYDYNHFAAAAVYDSADILSYKNGVHFPVHNVLSHETHTFHPNLLNDARFSYVREAPQRGPASNAPSVIDFGVQNIWQPAVKCVNGIAADGFFSFGDNPPAHFVRNNFSFSDDVHWVWGKHSFAFGGYVERSRVDVSNLYLQPATFEFSGNATGLSIADFLLGSIWSFQQGYGEFANNRDTFVSVYTQDNIKLTPRLTVNLGLRYEPYFPWHEIRGRIEQFNMNAYQQGITSKVFPNAPPGLFFRGDPGFPENGTTGDYRNFAPRVGFAYDLKGDGKTSLRAGAGIFYDSRTAGISNTEMSDVSPFSPQLRLTAPAGPFSNPLLGVPNPFPAPWPPPANSIFPTPVFALTYDPTRGFITPRMYNWNMSIERQLKADWVSRISYVGSHGSRLRLGIDLNPSLYDNGSALPPDQRRLFPGYTDIFESTQTSNSSYNSLQLALEKRFTHGVTLQANYTWSRSIDDLQYQGALADFGSDIPTVLPWYFPDFHSLDTGPSDFNHNQRFVLSYVWNLPGLHSASRPLRVLLGNWQVSGILTAQSGDALTVLAGQDQSGTASDQDHGQLVGAPYGSGACSGGGSCLNWLNPNSFQLPAPGAFGNTRKGGFIGPGSLGWDAGLMKEFPMGERTKWQFRAEFFNVLNHTIFNDPNNIVSGGGFGGIFGAADPRIGQLALKLSF